MPWRPDDYGDVLWEPDELDPELLELLELPKLELPKVELPTALDVLAADWPIMPVFPLIVFISDSGS